MTVFSSDPGFPKLPFTNRCSYKPPLLKNGLWKSYAKDVPWLYQEARKVMATSAPIEKVFSHAYRMFPPKKINAKLIIPPSGQTWCKDAVQLNFLKCNRTAV